MSDKARTDTICPLPIEVAQAVLLERLTPIFEGLDGLPDHPLLLTLAERCYLQGLRDAQLSLPQLLEVLSQDRPLTPAE